MQSKNIVKKPQHNYPYQFKSSPEEKCINVYSIVPDRQTCDLFIIGKKKALQTQYVLI